MLYVCVQMFGVRIDKANITCVARCTIVLSVRSLNTYVDPVVLSAILGVYAAQL